MILLQKNNLVKCLKIVYRNCLSLCNNNKTFPVSINCFAAFVALKLSKANLKSTNIK